MGKHWLVVSKAQAAVTFPRPGLSANSVYAAPWFSVVSNQDKSLSWDCKNPLLYEIAWSKWSRCHGEVFCPLNTADSAMIRECHKDKRFFWHIRQSNCNCSSYIHKNYCMHKNDNCPFIYDKRRKTGNAANIFGNMWYKIVSNNVEINIFRWLTVRKICKMLFLKQYSKLW